MKKRVKLQENGENGQSRENGQNEDIDSDDNYTEVGAARRRHRRPVDSEPNERFLLSSCEQDIMSPLQEESGCDEDNDEEEGREEEEGFDSDESLVDSDSDSDDKGASPKAHPSRSRCGSASSSSDELRCRLERCTLQRTPSRLTWPT